MSEQVPASEIEGIVGAPRHETDHYARAVSDEQRVYVLHSKECLGIFDDLRDCPFSKALDRGIDPERWSGFEDRPVRAWVSFKTLKLVPENLVGGGA